MCASGWGMPLSKILKVILLTSLCLTYISYHDINGLGYSITKRLREDFTLVVHEDHSLRDHIYNSIFKEEKGYSLTHFPRNFAFAEKCEIIFQDDFESYPANTFPSSGGWELVWDGAGEEYQVVVDNVSVSGSKSFQLWGVPGWSAVAHRLIDTDARIIGLEFYIRIESYDGDEIAAHSAFFNRYEATWGAYYGVVKFRGDGSIIIGGNVVGSWTPSSWYKVRVIIDRHLGLFDVWINDTFIGVFSETKNSWKINAIALTSAHAGVKVYYDDVMVFKINEMRMNPKGWHYPLFDTKKVSVYPFSSAFFVDSSDYVLTYNISIPSSLPFGGYWYWLAGDINNDGYLELILTNGSHVFCYSVGGLVWCKYIPGESTSGCNWYIGLGFLKDVNNDGYLELIIGRRTNDPQTHTLKIYVLSGNGTVLREITRLGGYAYEGGEIRWIDNGYDSGIWPVDLIDVDNDGQLELISAVGAGYSKNPRGVISTDFLTGDEEWWYDYGPAFGGAFASRILVLSDINKDGIVEIILTGFTPHNGAYGYGVNGTGSYTTDDNIFVVTINGNGDTLWSYDFGRDGYLESCIADIDGDQNVEIILFEGHNGYYPGYKRVLIYDTDGNLIKDTEVEYDDVQPGFVMWHTVCDLDGDCLMEIIVSGEKTKTIYVYNYSLDLIATKTFNDAPKIYVSCDYDGDNYSEIFVSVGSMVYILGNNLSIEWSYQVNASVEGFFPIDIDNDYIIELMIMTSERILLFDNPSPLPIEDTIPPAIDIRSPSEGQYIREKVTVEVDVTDIGTGIMKIEFYLDRYLLCIINESPYSFVLDTKALSDGLHNLTAVAYDYANNSNRDTVLFYVDNTLPIIEDIDYYKNPASWEKIWVKVIALDMQSGISHVILYYSTNNGASWKSINMNQYAENSYRATIPGQLPGTKVLFFITVQDLAGNNKSSQILKCYVSWVRDIIIISIITILIIGIISVKKLIKRRKEKLLLKLLETT